MHRQDLISIWFFIGVILLAYGVLILGSAIYQLSHPLNIVMEQYHAGVWWGAILTAAGLFYTIRFFPRRRS